MLQHNIPDYWSAEQAYAIYEFLNDIQERIWKQYEFQFIELLRPDPDEVDDHQMDLFELDDKIEF